MNKYYITTSIPYVNSTPHLGNVLDSVYADVLARYHRQHGFDVRFLTGTDEHGAKIARSAEAAGITPSELVDKNSEKFKALREALNLSWDDFIRTSDVARHYPGAQKFWKILESAGDLYKKIYSGLYCVGHEAFITDKDLDNSICIDHQKAPEVIEEENWFFKLSKYTQPIKEKIESSELRVTPDSRKSEILGLLKEGLEDVSFSRPRKDLSWGVPVPGDNTQTMYVWAEALVNYISALGFGSADEALFQKYWPADVQVIGKDNLRFHAAIWAGMLLSAKLPLPKNIFVHGFLTVDGQKISKTVGNVVDPYELVKKYGTDPVRHYLLREISPAEDGDYSEKKFIERYNADLANGLGNLVSRVFTLAGRHEEIVVDLVHGIDSNISERIAVAKNYVADKLGLFKFNDAVAAIFELVAFGDKYVNDNKPWAVADNQKILVNAITIIDNVAALLLPFLPATAEKITKSIIWTGDNKLRVIKGESLFPRLV